MNDGMQVQAEVINPVAWLALWWAHLWRVLWRFCLAAITFVIVVSVILAIAVAANFVQESVTLDMHPLLEYAAAWLIGTFCSAWTFSVLTRTPKHFAGYSFKFDRDMEGNASRKMALFKLSWAIIWRVLIVELPLSLARDAGYEALIRSGADKATVMMIFIPASLVCLLITVVTWCFVVNKLRGKEFGGYRFDIIPAQIKDDAIQAS